MASRHQSAGRWTELDARGVLWATTAGAASLVDLQGNLPWRRHEEHRRERANFATHRAVNTEFLDHDHRLVFRRH